MIGVTACFPNVPILILSRDLRIRRFTPTATTVLNVIASDIGHPIGDVTLNIHVADLPAMLADSIDSMSVKESEVQDREGHWYALRIRPCRTLDDRIDGAVLVLIDIDDIKRSLKRRGRRARLCRDDRRDGGPAAPGARRGLDGCARRTTLFTRCFKPRRPKSRARR